MSQILEWEDLSEAERQAIKVLSERSFLAFNRIFFQLLQGERWSVNWHHRYIAQVIEDNRIFQPVIDRLPTFFALTSQFNDKQWRMVVKGGTGYDIPPSQAVIAGQTTAPVSSGVLGVDAYRAEPWLREMQELWVSENTRLIKSIPADELSDMEGIIQRGVMNGSSAETIKKHIQERYGVTERRAKLIAVDQIGKANSALTKQRQADAGITGYKWRGVLDERERPEHRAREGNSYKWSNPPPDGHPGQPVRCRCYAEPDWSGSVFDIGE